MKQYITASSIANAIGMKRSKHKGAFLVVEGITDKRVYGLVVESRTCEIENGHGIERAVEVIRILNGDSFSGVLAVLDADFVHITHTRVTDDNIVYTDLHDLECLLLRSPAFERLLEEFASEERVSAYSAAHGDIASHLASIASRVGCLRLISLKDGLELKFEGLKFRKFVSFPDLAIDIAEMVRAVLNNSQKHQLDARALSRQVESEERVCHDRWQICCGHDIMEVLSIAMRKQFSGKSGGDVDVSTLECSLRLAWDPLHLEDTQLYRDILDWERSNPGFQVLKRES